MEIEAKKQSMGTYGTTKLSTEVREFITKLYMDGCEGKEEKKKFFEAT